MKLFKSMKKAELIEELAFAHQVLCSDDDKAELADLVASVLAEYEASPKKVTKDELIELCEEVKDEIAQYHKENQDKIVKEEQESLLDEKKGAEKLLSILEGGKTPVETSPKKLTKKTSQKDNDTQQPLKHKDNSTKPVEKSSKNEKAIDLAVQFPKTIKVEDDTFNLDMSIKSVQEIAKISENPEEELLIAIYWTPRLIKQFNYDPYGVSENKITKFKDDLDLCSVIHIADSGKVMYALSLYSDVMYMIKPDELEIIDGMRYTKGAEFNIYRKKL